jgi:hypothetical protein
VTNDEVGRLMRMVGSGYGDEDESISCGGVTTTIMFSRSVFVIVALMDDFGTAFAGCPLSSMIVDCFVVVSAGLGLDLPVGLGRDEDDDVDDDLIDFFLATVVEVGRDPD